MYQRSPSQTTFVAFEVSGYSLEYKRNDSASFDYLLSSVSWHQALRNLQYQIALGANSIKKEEESTSPYYQFSADWREPNNRVSLSLRQLLTDTSQGAGGSELGDVALPDSGRIRVVDEYRSQEAGVSWVNSSLCQRCSSSFRLSWQREDYENFDEQNNVEQSAIADLRYQPRLGLALTIGAQQTRLRGDAGSLVVNYSERRYRLAAVWSKVAKRGRLELYAQTLEREFEDNTAYDQDLVGLRFDWLLYER